MKIIKRTLTVVSLLFFSITANASLIIGDATSTRGNWFPFGGGGTSGNWGPTYQMRFDASLFSSDIIIDTLRFYKLGSSDQIADGTYTLSLSTTNGPFTSDAESNLGSDNTVVYTGSLVLNGSFLDFDISNFFYDTSAGDLLLSVTASDNTANFVAYFADSDNGGVQRLYRNSVQSTRWLTTGFNQFSSVEISEPSVLWIFALSFLGLSQRRLFVSIYRA
jgi:hypothetical protein